MQERGIAPPEPDWRRRHCGKTLYLRKMEAAPEACPACGSTDVLNLHIQEFVDPPPSNLELEELKEEH
ncbi:MAG: hypothetical protein WC310_04065 [Patescibacteria group bacterium]|jgi:pyruvate/2-oxoacid:ferredoxin oxidoreductase beta subunit